MAKLIATKAGAALKCNKWVEGKEVICDPKTAEIFIRKGFAEWDGEAPKEKAPKAPKEKK